MQWAPLILSHFGEGGKGKAGSQLSEKEPREVCRSQSGLGTFREFESSSGRLELGTGGKSGRWRDLTRDRIRRAL